MTMATTQAKPGNPQEPTSVVIDRKTKGGRSLQYRLTVMQQPERARACGSGSKCELEARGAVDTPS